MNYAFARLCLKKKKNETILRIQGETDNRKYLNVRHQLENTIVQCLK